MFEIKPIGKDGKHYFTVILDEDPVGATEVITTTSTSGYEVKVDRQSDTNHIYVWTRSAYYNDEKHTIYFILESAVYTVEELEIIVEYIGSTINYDYVVVSNKGVTFTQGPLKSVDISPNEYELTITNTTAKEVATTVELTSSIVSEIDVTYYSDKQYSNSMVNDDSPVLGTTANGIEVRHAYNDDNTIGMCAWEQNGMYVQLTAPVSQFDMATISLLIETIIIVPR